MTFYRRIAYPTLVFAFVTLAAVLVIGHSVAGQRNWIELGGPFRFQPSEFAKLALVLWGSDLLARKQGLLDQWKHLLVPLVPVVGLMVLLVLLEGDLGTALILVPMLAAILYVNGAPARLFVAGGAVVLAGVAVLSLGKSYRLARFASWLDPGNDALGSGWQILHGQSALGGGGWFGVGLGASREKWGWLPEAHTDFIFAVVGEELGIIGTLLVVGAVRGDRRRGPAARAGARPTRSCAPRRRPSSRGCSRRRCSTSEPCCSSSRSPASRCRSCPTAAPRSSPRSSRSACSCRSRGPRPVARRARPRRRPPAARGR